jgi:hypothetical protein
MLDWCWLPWGARVPHAIATDPQHWRTRAAEARAMADQIAEAEAKAAMLDIAKKYEQIAKRVEQRQPRQGAPS